MKVSSRKPVAIKKIAPAFRDVTEAKRVLREIVIQGHMEHRNVRLPDC